MRKIIIIGIIGALVLFHTLAFTQQEKEGLLKKQAQSEIKADSSDYVIGPEDVLYIHVWKEGTLTRTVPVRIDGNISLPLIDDVRAAGLTPLQLKEVLTEKLKKFVDSPDVSVTVMEANSYKVYVSGEVKSPGIFRLRSETSLIHIIIMAGGFTEWADPKRILIIRKFEGKEKRTIVNYKKIMKGEDSGLNFVLKAGDIIIVP
jgi:polysaccharide export outer membrane protein